MYADDTAIFIEGDNEAHLQQIIDSTIPTVADWFSANQMSVNSDKTVCQIYNNSKNKVNVSVFLAGPYIKIVKTVKYLGMYVDDDLRWISHISQVATTLSRNIGLISRVRYFLIPKQLLHLTTHSSYLTLPRIVT